jgi:hypothetical protein
MSPTPGIPNPIVIPFAHVVNFESPTGIGIGQYVLDQQGPQSGSHPRVRLVATPVNVDEVDIEVQTREGLSSAEKKRMSDDWISAGTLRIAYGRAGAVDLTDTTLNQRPTKMRLVLHPQLLRDTP